jgi:hypothetical protein
VEVEVDLDPRRPDLLRQLGKFLSSISSSSSVQ